MNTNDASSNKTLPQLSDASADPTTGDIREVAFAIAEALYQAALAQSANLPNRMTITRSVVSNTGVAGSLKNIYTFTFQLSAPTYTIISE